MNTFEQQLKDSYFNELAEKGIELVKGGRLYGYNVDITNPRDVIAALYCAYTHKEMMVESQERLNNLYVQIHKG